MFIKAVKYWGLLDMDWTEWIALSIVAAVGIFLLLRFILRKKHKKCCPIACPLDESNHKADNSLHGCSEP